LSLHRLYWGSADYGKLNWKTEEETQRKKQKRLGQPSEKKTAPIWSLQNIVLPKDAMNVFRDWSWVIFVILLALK